MPLINIIEPVNPRERSLCSCPPLPKGAQPLTLPTPVRGSAALAPFRGFWFLSYSDISVMDKTICFCCRRLLWVSFYVVSLF